METKGQAAIVTGGASGLGLRVRALSLRQAQWLPSSMSTKAAAEVADSIKGIAIACDVADSASGEAAVKKPRPRMGPRDPGQLRRRWPRQRIVGRDGPMPLADYERVIRINLIGTFNMMRLVAGALQSGAAAGGERGVIVSTASVPHSKARSDRPLTLPPKEALLRSHCRPREFAQFGIRVLAIAPGILLRQCCARCRERRTRSAPRYRFPNAWVSRANSRACAPLRPQCLSQRRGHSS
jgi:NAD(P)-dependent dehydrogenase (short-subunit alcohol dehydrogenase family)